MPSFQGLSSPVSDSFTLEDESTIIPINIKNSPTDMASYLRTSESFVCNNITNFNYATNILDVYKHGFPMHKHKQK
jgi:hypothetical protein